MELHFLIFGLAFLMGQIPWIFLYYKSKNESSKSSWGEMEDLITVFSKNCEQNQKLFSQVERLNKIFDSPILCGRWGERSVEDLLIKMGFSENVSFIKQKTLPSGHRPDFTILLPQGFHLHVEVKLPGQSYLTTFQNVHEESFVKKFLMDSKKSLRDIAQKKIPDQDPKSLPMVIALIPHEGIFSFLHQKDPDFLDSLLIQNVLVVSTHTFFSVLAVVRKTIQNGSWNVSALDKQAWEKLKVHWNSYELSLQNWYKRSEEQQKAWDELTTTRFRQLSKAFKEVLGYWP